MLFRRTDNNANTSSNIVPYWGMPVEIMFFLTHSKQLTSLYWLCLYMVLVTVRRVGLLHSHREPVGVYCTNNAKYGRQSCCKFGPHIAAVTQMASTCCIGIQASDRSQLLAYDHERIRDLLEFAQDLIGWSVLTLSRRR